MFKKTIKYIIFLMICFVPFYNVLAADTYTVEMVQNQTNNKVVGTYNSYEDALKVMNNQNSSESSVATIFRNGVAVDSKYGIFKFKPGSSYTLYENSNGTAYTSIHGSYSTDAALLGYSSNGRVKIMISGYVGWTDINNGVVTPISLLGINGNKIYFPGKGNTVRADHSTSSTKLGSITSATTFTYTDTYVETLSSGTRTWYKISYNGKDAWIAEGDSMEFISGVEFGTYYYNYSKTGNLIHHFTIYSGSGYSDGYSNLGTSPTFMTTGVHYFSFDGNYFYSSLTSMLDDYRSFTYNGNIVVGTYERSVNKDNPYYAYYLYQPSHSISGYTASDLDNIIISKGYNSSSKMYGTGAYFKEAEALYGKNALTMFSVAAVESNYGTSSIAVNKNNLFGYGASDSDPYNNAYSYDSPRDSILDYAKKTGTSYNVVTGTYYYGSHLGNKASGENVKYATDAYSSEKKAGSLFVADKNYGSKDFNASTIGVTKKSHAHVKVYKEANTSSVLYTMKNQNTDAYIYDMPVTVVDKVGDFYKIYTDLPASDNTVYGYVKVSDFNVSNNQPTINASDKTVNVGGYFNPLEGVSALDKEAGDLTNKISYSGSYDLNKAGSYDITYTVKDNQNFSVSKTIKLNVVSENTLTIEASDKEVKQYTEFDYTEGVMAKDDNGDLTDKITYEKTVDTSKAGTYKVTYNVVNDEGKEISKSINVTVIADEKPVINATDKEVYLNSEFDYMNEVTASDKEDGDLTDKIIYEKTVDTSKVGTYEVTYKVSDKHNQEVVKKISVNVVLNSEPIINVSDKTISVGDEFKALDNVTASDKEDGDLTSKVTYKDNVDVTKEGEYEVTYMVTDSYNQTVSKTIKVTVSKKVLKEADGWFHIEKLSFNNDEMIISGFEVILGHSNSKNDNIDYKLILEDQDTNKTFTYNLERWLENIPFTPLDSSDNNYSGAWFEGNVDISSIPAGDYSMYIMASDDNYYVKEKINNSEYNTNIVRKYKDSNNRGYAVRENKSLVSIALELFVRDDGLLSEGITPVWSGLYNDFYSYGFKNGELNIIGTSYALKTNYSSNDNVERWLFLENIDTHKVVYEQKIDSITSGAYNITSNYDLTRAWFDANIKLDSLEIGKYVIYIKTKVNSVEDYNELNDYAYSDLNKNITIDNKKISLTRNNKQRARLELVVQ